MRFSAIVLALAWATCWTIFGMLSSVGSGYFAPVAVFAMLMFGSIAVAWNLPIIGGGLLLLEATGAWVVFGPSWIRWSPASSIMLLCGTVVAPPFLSGVLLVATGVRDHWRQRDPIRTLHLTRGC